MRVVVDRQYMRKLGEVWSALCKWQLTEGGEKRSIVGKN